MNKKFFTFLLGLAAVFVLLLGCEKEKILQVWYSVKHGCAIDGEAVDLAAWRPYTIWPTDLWLDSKTYVVAEVKR